MRRAGIETEVAQAKALHMSRAVLSRVRNGRAAPGPEFIASAMAAFPGTRFEEMFRVVTKAVRP